MTVNVKLSEGAPARQGVKAIDGGVDEREALLVGTSVAPIGDAASREWAARLESQTSAGGNGRAANLRQSMQKG